MPDVAMLEEFLAGGRVDAAVFALRPDYRVLLLAVGGLVPGPSDQASDALLQAAEAAAREALGDYNAVSVLHQIPLGGEDLTRYAGAPRLVRATGAEPFDTAADGIAVTEHPDPGDLVTHLARPGPGLRVVRRLIAAIPGGRIDASGPQQPDRVIMPEHADRHAAVPPELPDAEHDEARSTASHGVRVNPRKGRSA